MGTEREDGRVIIGGGVTGARLFPDDLVDFQCPDHLMKELAGKTAEYLKKLEGNPGAYAAESGSLQFTDADANLRSVYRFFVAANQARKDMKLREWPDFATWARANGLRFTKNPEGQIKAVQR